MLLRLRSKDNLHLRTFRTLTTMWNALTTPFTAMANAFGFTNEQHDDDETTVQMEEPIFEKGHPLFLTGKWRKPENQDLVRQLTEYFDTTNITDVSGETTIVSAQVTLVTAEDEAHGQARFAHKQLADFGYIDALWNGFYEKNSAIVDGGVEPLYVYMGAGRGSAQASVMTADGTILRSYYGDGFPRLKEGESHSYDNVAKIWADIVRDYDEHGAIVSVMMFDAMYYQAKEKKCFWLKDNDYLYKEWDDKTGRWLWNEDVYENIGFGRNKDQVSKPSFLCVRNFKTDDGISKKVHFLPTDKGPYAWDVGSGKMALVDTETGAQLKNLEFPDTVFTDQAEFLFSVAEKIRTNSRVYLPLVVDETWQQNDEAIAHIESLMKQKVITLTNEEKARNLATFVHKQLRHDGYIQVIAENHYDDDEHYYECSPPRRPEPVFVYITTFGDSAYAVVLYEDSEEEDMCPVYEAEHLNVTKIWQSVLEDYDFRDAIKQVVLLGDIYHSSDKVHTHREGTPLWESWEDEGPRRDWLYREWDFNDVGFNVDGLRGFRGGDRSSMPSFLALNTFQTGDCEDNLVMRYPHYLPYQRKTVWQLEGDTLRRVNTMTGNTEWACEIDPTQDISQIIAPILEH